MAENKETADQDMLEGENGDTSDATVPTADQLVEEQLRFCSCFVIVKITNMFEPYLFISKII